MSSDREQARLTDVIDNCEAALSHIGAMPFDAFEADRKTVDAVERCLERIIEAAIKIGVDRMGEIAPSIELHALRGMGNLLRHSYDLVDLRTIYTTVTNRLPELLAAARKALAA